MYLELSPELEKALPDGRDPFGWLLRTQGTVHREVKHRLTYEAQLGDQHFFVKRHLGCGWKEVCKEWYRLRKPVVSARTEWEGAEALAAAGVRVPRVLGKGERGTYPHAVESFVVLEALEDCETLEHFKEGWLGFTGARWVALKRILVGEVALMCRNMHNCGINHRDLYINHFLVNRSELRTCAQDKLPPLYLIDLHRVQQRSRVPSRWLQKDLCALLFSALDAGLTSADCVRFLRGYLGPKWKADLRVQTKLWRRVVRRAIVLYEDFHGQSPSLPRLLR
jgi:heptose I phosphotransferase